MSISCAASIAAEVSFLRMFGLGPTLAVLADATLIRMVSMPAFMHVMGEWNWWAPKWLSRIHDRFGLHHGNGAAATEQSSSKGPLNEAVADVVSTMRRVP
jgi:RND superfamily putative drug exporter